MPDPDENEKVRNEVVAEARSWAGTPYIHGARIKGVGCHCVTFLMEVFKATGHLTQQEVVDYSGDWFCHTNEERYMLRVVRHAYKIVEGLGTLTMRALPGSVVLTRVARSRVYNHGAIVTKWPYVIHSVDPEVVEVNILRNPMWATHEIAVFDKWPQNETSTALAAQPGS